MGDDRIQVHYDFWNRKDLNRPLVSFHPGEDFFFSRHYRATIHLHPASFFIVDELLTIDGLKAIEVNKDIGGPTVLEMIPVFQKIIEKKNLIIWGDLDEADMDMIVGELPPKGIYLNPVVPNADRANTLMNYLLKKTNTSY